MLLIGTRDGLYRTPAGDFDAGDAERVLDGGTREITRTEDAVYAVVDGDWRTLGRVPSGVLTVRSLAK